MDIGVIGAGGWGIALAKLLAEKGERITLWCHGADTCRDLREKRESSSYLPGVTLPAQVRITTELDEAVAGKSLLLDRKSTRLNSSHSAKSRMPSSA